MGGITSPLGMSLRVGFDSLCDRDLEPERGVVDRGVVDVEWLPLGVSVESATWNRSSWLRGDALGDLMTVILPELVSFLESSDS